MEFHSNQELQENLSSMLPKYKWTNVYSINPTMLLQLLKKLTIQKDAFTDVKSIDIARNLQLRTSCAETHKISNVA